MRILAAIVPLILLGAAPPTPTPPLTSPSQAPLLSAEGSAWLVDWMKHCGPVAPVWAETPPDEMPQSHFQHLGDLPPANEYAAMFRRGADGCPDPLVRARGIGLTQQR